MVLVRSHKLKEAMDTQGYDFIGVQMGLVVFGYIFHHIVYSAEQSNDKIFGSHEIVLFADGLVTFSLEHLMTFCN